MSNQWSMPTYEPINFPQVDVIGQLNTTLLSGVVCGLLPLIVASTRGRPDWGMRTLGVCFLAGMCACLGFEPRSGSSTPQLTGLPRRADSACKVESVPRRCFG